LKLLETFSIVRKRPTPNPKSHSAGTTWCFLLLRPRRTPTKPPGENHPSLMGRLGSGPRLVRHISDQIPNKFLQERTKSTCSLSSPSLPLSLHSSPHSHPLLSCPVHSPFLLCYEANLFNTARGLWERCKLPQCDDGGRGRSPVAI